jgi:hypothetical protein
VHLAPVEVDRLPLQVGHLGGAEAVPVGHQYHQRVAEAVPVVHQYHQRVAYAVAVGIGGLDQALDLGVGQMLAVSQFAVRRSARRPRFDDCPVFS